jgi:NADH-quinone oxidoreductase subunit A
MNVFALNSLSPPTVLAQAGPTLGYDHTAVFIFLLFGLGFVIGTVSLVSRLLRPSSAPANEPAKTETYECGEPAIGSSWVRFDIRFYLVALVFLIFDVEVAFLYPWALIFKSLRVEGLGIFVFAEMLVFILILVAGFAYCWSKGDLDWVKSLQSQRRSYGAGSETDGGRDSAEPEDAEEKVLVTH